MTPELFQRYLDGFCTREERDQVEHWLHTSTHQQLDELLLPRFHNSSAEMPEQQSKELWRAVAPPARMPYLAIAASILLLIAIGWWMMKPVDAPILAKRVIEDTVINTAGTINLPDGSTVELGGQSSLKFNKAFTQRNLYLQGKAIFTVRKDKKRPFTVYSGTISTTALGTIFVISAQPDSITVKLLEGKVVVKHGQESLLAPGQQLVYNPHTQTAILHKPSKPKSPVRIQQPQTPKDLAFNNTPLTEVLEKLTARYAASISYEKTALDGMYFTGAIAGTDELSVVLKAITQMNGLELVIHPNNYVIQPISR